MFVNSFEIDNRLFGRCKALMHLLVWQVHFIYYFKNILSIIPYSFL